MPKALSNGRLHQACASTDSTLLLALHFCWLYTSIGYRPPSCIGLRRVLVFVEHKVLVDVLVALSFVVDSILAHYTLGFVGPWCAPVQVSRSNRRWASFMRDRLSLGVDEICME